MARYFANLRDRLGMRKGRGSDMLPERLQDSEEALLTPAQSMQCLVTHVRKAAEVRPHHILEAVSKSDARQRRNCERMCFSRWSWSPAPREVSGRIR